MATFVCPAGAFRTNAALLGLVLFSITTHAEIAPPRSPADSLKAIHTKPGLVVELVASEPLVMDPVAIDWDARGRLWVVEQPDYPQGMDGNWKPGGRVKILTDPDRNGRYQKATLFLDNLPWPTGITCWRKGVLICAAPDILYAEDTDGDGKADVVKKLFTGFMTDNFNARVNSLALGLDNWMHGASGGRGGRIRSEITGSVTDISGRDIRLNPDTGEFQTVSGVTQHGRARNDWDDWFGCSNSRWIFHFPLPDHYLRRNPHVAAPVSSVTLTEPADSALNPASRPAERWNNFDSLGHVTAAGGLGIYRDTLLGKEFYGNAFIGDAAHNLVRRFRLDPALATFDARRPEDEASTEFFASEDNWTRPVQVRTGPDGALYVVDMYRAVIEHTRWIPLDKLPGLNVRAGDTMGRIYRVKPRDAKLRPIRDLTKLDAKGLVAALDTPNGTTRDLVHLQLLHRNAVAAAGPLAKLAASSELPAVRVQALAALEGLKSLSIPVLLKALTDDDAQVRRHALRLCEPRFAAHPELGETYLNSKRDMGFPDLYQTLLSFGEWDDTRAVTALGEIGRAGAEHVWLRAAVLSSSAHRPLEVLKAVLNDLPGSAGVSPAANTKKSRRDAGGPRAGSGYDQLVGQLIATAAAQATKPPEFAPIITVLAPGSGSKPASWQLAGLAPLLDSLDRKKLKLGALPDGEQLAPLFETARALAADPKAPEASRELALKLIGRGAPAGDEALVTLADLVKSGAGDRLPKAAMTALIRTRSPKVPVLLLADWSKRGPAQRLTILAALLSREEWTVKLLDAIESGALDAADVPVASRQELARHSSEGVRKRAAKMLPVGGSSDRAAVVARYQSVATLKGDGANGATVFANNCVSCHAYLGRGIELGPNLSAFRTKEARDFIVAILDPNAAMDARFTVYHVETKDGRSLTGVIASESATSVVVAQPAGVKETILRSDITTLRGSELSLMPEGLEAVLKPQDIADLIAFVKGSE